AAAPSRNPESSESQHPVSEIANVDVVKMAGAIVISKVREPLSHAVVPNVASLQRGLLGLEADVRAIEPERPIHISYVEGLGVLSEAVEHPGGLDKPIDVHLRHRPLSIPRRRGTAGVGGGSQSGPALPANRRMTRDTRTAKSKSATRPGGRLR